MLKATIIPYRLLFREAAITSRSTMLQKETFFLRIEDTSYPGLYGIGEVPLFRGLSAEDTPEFVEKVQSFCNNFDAGSVPMLSSLRFGVESALIDLEARRSGRSLPSFRIRINGLIWMGDKTQMYNRICNKLESGFKCLKLKIGGIDFEEELDLIRFIRKKFSPETLELRLDANCAFKPNNALSCLGKLAPFSIHSLEQPLPCRMWEESAKIVRESPIPIALDEELIGCKTHEEKEELLNAIAPHYVILKPSLCGGFESADQWIELAEKRNIGWWATSALESNIGLAAIARWVCKKNPAIPQGLGTGALYTNNIPYPMRVEGEYLVGEEVNPAEVNFFC